MREIRPSGSVRGVRRNPYPYRDTLLPMRKHGHCDGRRTATAHAWIGAHPLLGFILREQGNREDYQRKRKYCPWNNSRRLVQADASDKTASRQDCYGNRGNQQAHFPPHPHWNAHLKAPPHSAEAMESTTQCTEGYGLRLYHTQYRVSPNQSGYTSPLLNRSRSSRQVLHSRARFHRQ